MLFKEIPIEVIIKGVTIFLVVTAFLATIFYKKYDQTFLKYFLVLIWYDVATELIAPFYSSHISHNNILIFNIYRFVEFSFYFLLYQNLVTNLRVKKIIKVFFGIYLVFVIINLFIQDLVYEYFSNTYYIGASLIIISIILYFSEILNSEKIINITRMFSFWISIAVFMLYITTVPFKAISKYYENSPDIPYIYVVNILVVLIFYLIISIGLLWSKKE